MKPVITAIGTALPEYRVTQDEVAKFMINYLNLDSIQSRWLKNIYLSSGIQYRHSVLPDFKPDNQYPNLFDKKNDTPSTSERIEVYRNESLKLAEIAIRKSLDERKLNPDSITHLITVSCTGMHAPGLDIDLMEKMGFSPNTERTNIHYMGCYAVFNALKLARHITVSDPNAKVMIVAVELCSLHFQSSKDKEQLIANALFGDGSGAAIVENTDQNSGQLLLKDFKSQVIPNTKEAMTWTITDTGFEMYLSREIPDFLCKPIKPSIDDLLKRNSLKYEEIGHLAAHPGGLKILEAVEKKLPLPEVINSASRNVLKNYGNMSSPTILFVLEKLLEQADRQNYKPNMLGMAFGPGLTIESGLLEMG